MVGILHQIILFCLFFLGRGGKGRVGVERMGKGGRREGKGGEGKE